MQGNSSDAWEVGVNKYVFAVGPVMKSQSNLQTGFLKMLYLAVLQIFEKENWLEANKSVQLAVGRVDWRTNRRMQLEGILGSGLVSERQAVLNRVVVLRQSQNYLIQLSFWAQHTHTNDQSFCFVLFHFTVWATGRICHTQSVIWVVSVLLWTLYCSG